MREIYGKITELLDSRRSVAVATVIETAGSSPRGVGAKMIITGEGETFFSVGGGSLENLVTKEAISALKQGRSKTINYNLGERGETPTGMVCGGECTVFIEVLKSPERLVIFGAGHVGRELAKMASGVGFEVSLVDDRIETGDEADLPPGVSLVKTDETYRENLPAIDGETYVVVMTRSHPLDESILKGIAGREAAYVGMIGSSRKAKAVLAGLEEAGVDPAWLGKVKSPVGIKIGAETPAEIAVSILAEMIKVRREGTDR